MAMRRSFVCFIFIFQFSGSVGILGTDKPFAHSTVDQSVDDVIIFYIGSDL